MFKNIETYIQPFAGFLKAIIQKDYSTEWDLGNLAGSITEEFQKHEIQLAPQESIILLIALIPHIYPNFYDEVIKEAMPQGGDFPEFGGVRGSNHRGLLPTGETAQFILAGSDLTKRTVIQHFLTEGIMVRQLVLSLEAVKEGEPLMSGRIIINHEWVNRLLTGNEVAPKFGPEFPAKKITTAMTWDDLVLNSHTQNQLNDIVIWVKHNETLMQDAVMKRKIKPGYKALFHGPPGTGKTLTASLLGNHLNRDVYRIDLSQVVSKYIGETEKNLETIFVKAINKNWILFFDEADALFGKRTEVRSSNDRYANQEVSYLLQRIEDFPGLVILASNLKGNMDEAFLRRFHTIIHFAVPSAEERLILWEKSIPASYQLDQAIDLKKIADKYELSGAAILNVIHYAALQSISKNDQYLRIDDIVEAMRKEYRKEERTMN
ncbi:ATP-binding protein [Mucilaginibacter sp. BJC16-A38]|uniref:ATP-binding protein n=1 Tax=Mucilaginibacter phenanthrenivorans TaxID=1234842 RepID=UPI002158123B|nr:ATP-binding protein [Mucilaginibacter phenanthrenivorans]MCR8557634.1 ATP-binding protein [Mucilaginibacter phenanthrenivorans]